MINYVSTRGMRGSFSAAEAIVKGIADDKGLFVPTEIPSLTVNFDDLAKMTYQQIAKLVIGLFFSDFTGEEIDYCVDNAYDEKFEVPEIAKITKVGGADFLELYHGKTAAFKDMALSILPYLMTTSMKKLGVDKKICILTATSGDTGKAALEGFADVENTEIIVFYPKDGVSEVQRRQMVTQEGKNVHVYAIEGNFDDAQTGVKKLFTDDNLKEELASKGYVFSSANSINIGRLIPQVAYYVYAYSRLIAAGDIKAGDTINITVPTGNFGNILAAYYAMKMGIPVSKFICASNENKVLTDFFASGKYDTKRNFILTNSPSMDILISSNLERLIYHLSNTEELRELMASLDNTGKYTVSDSIRNGLSCFYAGFADMNLTCKTIGDLYKREKYLVDTHTAVAYAVYEQYKKETGDDRATVISSTASPYKFPRSVASSIGLKIDEMSDFECVEKLNEFTGVRVPKAIDGLENRAVKHDKVFAKDSMLDALGDALCL